MNIVIHGTGAMGTVLREILKDEVIAFVDNIDEVSEDKKVDVVIDFSHYSKLKKLVRDCEKRGYPLVIATTGYNGEILEEIVSVSKEIPILLSANTSLGISAVNEILKKIVPKLEGYDIEVIEKHHNKKLDSPSGTALKLIESIQSCLDEKYKLEYGREGMKRREKKEIGVHSVRGGTIVGEHTIIFSGEDEIIEITHKAQSKKIFAIGAINCAKFLIGKPPKLYTMEDIFK